MISESIVENLFKEIDWIISRKKSIVLNLKETNNSNLKFRLESEFALHINRLLTIKKLSLEIQNLNKESVSLSSLLVEKCKRTNSEVLKGNELFFT